MAKFKWGGGGASTYHAWKKGDLWPTAKGLGEGRGGLNLVVRVFNALKMTKELRAIAKAADNPSGVFETIMKDFAQYERSVFIKGGAVHGLKGWAKLKPSTLANKKAQGYSSRILVRTGELEQSLTQPGHKHFKFRIIGKTSMEIGTTIPYAEILKKGIKGRMAARNPIRIPKVKVKAWGAMFKRYVLSGGKTGNANDASLFREGGGAKITAANSMFAEGGE